uniref:Uncharacterized protein n=1 Tax=Chelydra serpentina TaxID=8475 RepID=A0A8C3XRP8_CHESE
MPRGLAPMAGRGPRVEKTVDCGSCSAPPHHESLLLSVAPSPAPSHSGWTVFLASLINLLFYWLAETPSESGEEGCRARLAYTP